MDYCQAISNPVGRGPKHQFYRLPDCQGRLKRKRSLRGCGKSADITQKARQKTKPSEHGKGKCAIAGLQTIDIYRIMAETHACHNPSNRKANRKVDKNQIANHRQKKQKETGQDSVAPFTKHNTSRSHPSQH